MKKHFLSAVVVLLLVASPVMAKEGFYAGAFMPTTTISKDAAFGLGSGKGWGLRVGNGFSRYIAIEINYSATKHDSVDLKGLAGDLKLNFPLTTLDRAQIMSVEPYVVLGYAHYELGKTSAVKSDGAQYGFGIELYLFRELSVNAGWTKSLISWDTTPKRDGDIKTVDVGLIYHFL
jgi:hypothetical protein